MIDSRQSPLVSIIVPYYHSLSFIKETISCCVSQTYTNIELVLINDGCQDEIEQLVIAQGDPRIKYYYQHNSGSAIARNYGLQKAKGEYVLFLDADDIISSITISQCVKNIKNNDAIYFNACKIDDVGKILSYEFFNPIYTPFNVINWMEKAPWCGCVMLKKEKILDKWNNCLDFIDEFDFYVNFALNNSAIIYLNKTLFFYRQHSSNTRKSNQIKDYRSSLQKAFKTYFNTKQYQALQQYNDLFSYYRNLVVRNLDINDMKLASANSLAEKIFLVSFTIRKQLIDKKASIYNYFMKFCTDK